MAKPIDESTNSGALASGKGGGVGGSSRLRLGTITTAVLPIDDCQVKTAKARVRTLGFMAEATLATAELSTGQHIRTTGKIESMRPDLLCLSWHPHTKPTVAAN